MKGLFQASLAASAVAVAMATPLAQRLQHRHLGHHHHHEKRDVVVITKTQQVVEIEYVYSTVYVDPATIVAELSSSSTSSSFSTMSSTSISSTSTSTSTSTSSSIYIPPPPPSPTSTTESSTSIFTPASLPTEVIPLVVPSSSSSTTPIEIPTPVFTPAPLPTTTYIPEPVSTEAPPPTQPSTSPSNQEMFYGEGTYYDCGLGSCGNTNTNDDYVVAMSKLRMAPLDGGNPNNNPLCGQKVRVYSDMAPDGVVFTIMDKCPGCGGISDLDICKGPFLSNLGTEVQGRIKIWWHFEK